MEITCEHCEATLNIPDEKIPKRQIVRISCPKCKSKISINTGKQLAGPEQTESGLESKESDYSYGDYSEDEALGAHEEGIKLALVLDSDPESSGKTRSEIEQLGYHCIEADNTRDAVGKMRFHLFDLVILCDGFDGQNLDNSPILNYLNNISMADRRKIFVALMGERFKSMDNLIAFAMSANAVINPKDTDKLSALLKGAISDHEKFYKVFMETLVEVGRA
ncbi:MAG: zinc-ribbon domain-containing protein [Deltaproteobacteria bacterium]|nr:zinc-ribbon domain-containing protein [Deltaproteobacteria bacterium]